MRILRALVEATRYSRLEAPTCSPDRPLAQPEMVGGWCPHCSRPRVLRPPPRCSRSPFRGCGGAIVVAAAAGRRPRSSAWCAGCRAALELMGGSRMPPDRRTRARRQPAATSPPVPLHRGAVARCALRGPSSSGGRAPQTRCAIGGIHAAGGRETTEDGRFDWAPGERVRFDDHRRRAGSARQSPAQVVGDSARRSGRGATSRSSRAPDRGRNPAVA